MVTVIIIVSLIVSNICLSYCLYKENKLNKEQARMIQDVNEYHERIYSRVGSLKKYFDSEDCAKQYSGETKASGEVK